VNAQLRAVLPSRFSQAPSPNLVPIRAARVHRLRRLRLEAATPPLDLARPGVLQLQAGQATLLAHDWSLPLEPGAVLVCDGRERLSLRAGPDGALLLCGWPDPLALPPSAGRSEPQRSALLALLHPPGSRLARLMQGLAAELGGADVAELHGRRGQAWLEAVLAVQGEHEPAIARCHGRTRARRRDLYVRLSRTRALLAAPGCDGPDVATLARIARLSTSHYVRLFHQVFGEPPHRLRSRLRMERARDLLLEGRLPIAAILWQAGYTSHSCFARAFRQHFGCSATEMKGSALTGSSARSRAGTARSA